MRTTPQERLALGVVALLLVLGAGFRWARPEPDPVRWAGAAEEAPTDRAAAEAAKEERRALPLAPGERIDPNQADAVELERLPRVGPALAARIVERRQSHGSFRTLADLDSVSGVGPALLAAMAQHLALPAAPAALAEPRAAERAPVVTSAAGPLDVNSATAAELEALPGIGPALAGRIVEWRERHGRFRGVEALAEVPGIGEGTVRRVAPLVRASP